MRRLVLSKSTLCGIALLILAPVVDATDREQHDENGKTKKVGVWFPANDFYPRYIADPLRPQNALMLQWLADTEVFDTGAFRSSLRLGGSFGIRRWHPEGEPQLGWQLSFEGAFAGQFDLSYSWDSTGWDGFYGLYLSTMLSPQLGLRFGTQHNSSHVGDEYMARTGIERIHYTREEAVFGIAWKIEPRVTVYSELGWGNGLAGSMTFRLETGLQWVSQQKYWKGRASRFAAVDVRTYEDSDWSVRLTVQAGYWIPVGNRSSVHRLAVELGSGRSVMGQFLWEKETWLGIGWYYDF